ncbi:MAG: hypothetical protein HC879_07950 [Leptolyngbyaceae cyanobacterium SL_5_9]|nr:hypothetical protein [Leptolyngbyaceae cyanobacterium SM1_4_3]NJN57427.1 hypothetical protein [Leptolyngbyaceae cyanobacterium SL_5_9]
MVESSVPFNPFPGLRPFRTSEDYLFYGREGQIDQLVRVLSDTRFLTVVGVSGSGKSSLIRAGLIPALHGGFMATAGSTWRIAILRPEDNPIRNLARSLHQAGLFYPDEEDPEISVDVLETLLRRGSQGLLDVTWQAQLPEATNLLVLVDQFEELFRFKQESDRRHAADEAAAFVKLLLNTRGQRELPIYIILTMRSDFLGECAQFRDLPEAINAGQYLIPRMTRTQIRAAIEQPVAVGDATITPQLVNKLLNAVGDNPDQLPILQHVLMRIWDIWAATHQPDEPLDLEHYKRTGGMECALSNHADLIYRELSDRQQKIAELLFKRLTQRTPEGQDTRDPARLGDICAIARATEMEVIAVVEAFRAEGRSFLMPPVDEAETLSVNSLLDISHESLMRLWQRLRTWVAEEVESAEAYRRLVHAAQRHESEQGELWTGIDLASALRWKTEAQPDEIWARRYHPLNSSAIFRQSIDFLNKSEQNRLYELNRERRIGISLIVLSLATALAAVLASLQYVNAQRFQLESKNSLLTSRLSSAEATFALNDQLAALVIALQSGEQLQQPSTVSSDIKLSAIATLRQIVYGIRERDRFIHGIQPDNFLDEKKGWVYSASLSSDGRWMASGGGDFTVKLWSTDGTRFYTLEGHTDAVHDVAFSPTEPLLASAGADNVIRLWRLDGSPVRLIGTPKTTDELRLVIEAISFSPDGTLIAAAQRDGTVMLWDISGNLVRTFSGHQGWVHGVDFSPGGDRLVSGSADGTVKLWDISGTLLKTWNHDESVQDVAFSPDGQLVASAGNDNHIKLWQVDGELVRTLVGHSDFIYGVKFSPDGEAIASASTDRTAKLWNAADGTLLDTFQGHRNVIQSIDFSADGETLISAGFDNTVRLWSRTRTDLERVENPEGIEIRSVSISPNNQLVAFADDNGTVNLWNTATQAFLEPLEEHEAEVFSTAFSSDGQYLLTGSLYGTVKLWKIGESKSLQTLEIQDSGQNNSGQNNSGQNNSEQNRDTTYSVTFHPDKELIAGASSNGTITLWDIDGRLLRSFQAHEGGIYGLAFSPNGNQIASASEDQTVKLWSLDGRLLTSFTGHQDWVYSVSFSPNGQEIVSASADRTIRRWRLDGALIGRPLRGHENAVSNAIFAPDGNTIASASYDNTVRLWSHRQGTLLRTLEGHDDFVYSLSFSADGKTLSSSSADGSVILWNLDLENLMNRGCQWAFAYIQKNLGSDEDDSSVCSDRPS